MGAGQIWVGRPFNTPFGWGLSSRYKAEHTIEQRWLNIDAGASTVVTRFDSNLESMDHLKHDVTFLAHYLRPSTSVLVIGVGGGRDILAALAFGQTRIVGVEINHDILGVLSAVLPDYTGNLSQISGVELVHDEARSFVTRTDEKFGIIQASLIDTWAATSAGAYAFSENGLYTKEAWISFLDHLEEDGLLTMSRWNWVRMVSLGMAALEEIGVKNPLSHMIVVQNQSALPDTPPVYTLLVGRKPFSDEDITKVGEVSDNLAFEPVLLPGYIANPAFNDLVNPATYDEFVKNFNGDISAPTDDRPFFFFALRPGDLLEQIRGGDAIGLESMRVLVTVLVLVVGLCLLAVIAPLLVSRRVRGTQSLSMMVYFAAIGLAFMMVEIGQLERLILFLGHPIYGLTVVVFVLLSASSVGSWYADRVGHWVWTLVVVLVGVIWLGPLLTSQFEAASTPVRIGVSVLMLSPLGFLMGMPFPLGMELAMKRGDSPTAWYWGINGAFSVVSSVLALIVAILWGITATLLVGLVVYSLALAMLWVGRERVRRIA